MSPNLWGGGHINAGADPVGVGVGVGVTLSCLNNIGFLPNFHGYIIGTYIVAKN